MVDNLQAMEKQAQTLMHAAAIFEEMLDSQSELRDEGVLEDDETSDEMESEMETAMEACQAVSMAMTMAMFEAGHVPDFDTPERTAEEDDDSSPTYY